LEEVGIDRREKGGIVDPYRYPVTRVLGEPKEPIEHGIVRSKKGKVEREAGEISGGSAYPDTLGTGGSAPQDGFDSQV
jgi:hypothetical protein